MSEMTHLLDAAAAGDSTAAAELLPLVYDELRKLAAARLAREAPGQTLDATGLVHEAYLRLVGTPVTGDTPVADAGGTPGFHGRGHFFAAAAEAMRRILIDRARAKATDKRGGRRGRLDIDAVDLATTATPDQLLAIDEALARLAAVDPTAGRLVELRYFAGLSVAQAGAAAGVSTATAYRLWNFARAWLHSELCEPGEGR